MKNTRIYISILDRNGDVSFSLSMEALDHSVGKSLFTLDTASYHTHDVRIGLMPK